MTLGRAEMRSEDVPGPEDGVPLIVHPKLLECLTSVPPSLGSERSWGPSAGSAQAHWGLA